MTGYWLVTYGEIMMTGITWNSNYWETFLWLCPFRDGTWGQRSSGKLSSRSLWNFMLGLYYLCNLAILLNFRVLLLLPIDLPIHFVLLFFVPHIFSLFIDSAYLELHLPPPAMNCILCLFLLAYSWFLKLWGLYLVISFACFWPLWPHLSSLCWLAIYPFSFSSHS